MSRMEEVELTNMCMICEEKSVKVLYVDGADHSLEILGEPFTSIHVLEEVMHFIEMEI